VLVSAATVVLSPAAVAQTSDRPALVAIFAHPDDEIAVGPLLARYAREGADVRVVFATNGEKGTRITAIPAGEALGRARALEALAFDCHESQYTQEERVRSRPRFNQLLNGYIYLRPAFAHETPRSDLFR